MERKPRRVAFLAALGDKRICLPRNFRCTWAAYALSRLLPLVLNLTRNARHRVQRSIFVQQLAIPQVKFRPRRKVSGYANPSRKVHTHVVNKNPRLRRTNLDRLPTLRHPNRRLGLRSKLPNCLRRQFRRSPASIVEPGQIPPFDLLPRVVNLAQINVVSHDRPVRDLPPLTGSNYLRRSILVGQYELGDHPRPSHRKALAQVKRAKKLQRQRVVPTISQHHANAVVPSFQCLRDVIDAIQHPVLNPRPTRIKHMVPNPLAIQRRLVIA